jgi:hypothetical protein
MSGYARHSSAASAAGVARSHHGDGGGSTGGGAAPLRPVCARCDQDDTRYLDPERRLWYATCGHSLCEACKRDMFAAHRVNKCPTCGATLYATDFSRDTPEDREYQTEIRVRKRLAGM